MVNKELEQEAEAFASKDFSNKSSFEYHCQYSSYIAGATQSSTVKTLERENYDLKTSLLAGLKIEGELKSTVKELEREVADLKDALAQTTKGYEIMRDKRFEAEREVDRLKALAFKEFESKISLWGLTRAQYDREVEVFKERKQSITKTVNNDRE